MFKNAQRPFFLDNLIRIRKLGLVTVFQKKC